MEPKSEFAPGDVGPPPGEGLAARPNGLANGAASALVVAPDVAWRPGPANGFDDADAAHPGALGRPAVEFRPGVERNGAAAAPLPPFERPGAADRPRAVVLLGGQPPALDAPARTPAPAPSDRVVHDAAALAALPPSTAGLVLGGEPDAETADEAADEAELSTTRTVLEWCAVLAGALVVALVLKSFLFQAFLIPSESMTPTLEVSDRVLVNKLSYRLHGVERGDVVVFRRPPSEVVEGGPNDDLIKRVVGLPGDMVEIRDSSVFVNGQKLDEPYLAESLRYSDPNGETVHRVAEHEVFVMGDNRSNSRDSRFFGPIDQDLIVGRAFLKVWPPSSIELL